jgi:hypothetical protein
LFFSFSVFLVFTLIITLCIQNLLSNSTSVNAKPYWLILLRRVRLWLVLEMLQSQDYLTVSIAGIADTFLGLPPRLFDGVWTTDVTFDEAGRVAMREM